MKSDKLSTSLVWAWAFFILMGSLIVYIGYRSTQSGPTQTRLEISPGVVQAVSVNSDPDTRSSGEIQSLSNRSAEISKQVSQGQVTQEERLIVLGKSNSDKKQLYLKDFPCPANGAVLRQVGNYYSDSFGNYLFHAGVDYEASEGMVIRATHGGKVTYSGPDPLLGQKVVLDCGESWLVTYGGLDNLRVKAGEQVETRDALGQVGLYPGVEGVSDHPQLHYEVWHGNEVQRLEPKPAQ